VLEAASEAGVRRGPAFGYLCMPSHVSAGRAAVWRRQMSTFAIVEGLTITRWFAVTGTQAGRGSPR